MIGREDFTTPEWRDMQAAMMGTIKLMTMVSPHFYGDIKDQLVAKQAINDYIKDTGSNFIEELADFDDYKSPFPDHADDSAAGLEPDVLRIITNSVAAIKKRDPAAVVLFKNLIIKLAYKTAAARIQISPAENEMFQKIALALEAEPEPEVKEWDPANPLAK
jgi:hypothetical protein